MRLLDAFLLESEARVNLIISKQGDKLNSYYTEKVDNNRFPTLKSWIEYLDKITDKYLQWVVNGLIVGKMLLRNGIIRPENEEYFKLFDQFKSRMERKDINQYRDFMDLKNSIDDVRHTISKRQLDKNNFSKLIDNGDAEIIHKGSNFIVYQIKSVEASMVLGRGTIWCTAGDKNNMFADYKRKGDIYIFIINGNKYQIFFDLLADKMRVDFMDAQDESIFTRHSSEITNDIFENKEVVEYLNTLADYYDADMIRDIDMNWWKSKKVKDFLEEYGHKFYDLFVQNFRTRNKNLYRIIKDGMTDHLYDTHNIHYMALSEYNSRSFKMLCKMIGINDDPTKIFDELYYDKDNYITETDKEKTIFINKNKRIGFIFAGPEEINSPMVTIFIRMGS